MKADFQADLTVKLLQVDSRYYIIKEYFTYLLQSLV